MARVNLATLHVTSKDIGFTQAATVWIGDTEIISFRTRTRHEDYSLEMAEDVVKAALLPIFKTAVEESQCELYIDEEEDDDDT